MSLRSALGRTDALPDTRHRDGAAVRPAVLVVEDDPLVRAGVLRTLARLGYGTWAASDAAEALALLRSAAGGVDLLFTDVRMPGGMDGFELVRVARREFPALAVLLTTGFAGSSPRETAGRILYKPYKLADLAAAVRESLAEGGTAR